MPKIFWSSLSKWRHAALIGAALNMAQIAQADEEVPHCASLSLVERHQAAARDSWPAVLENAFDADGNGHAQLSVSVLIAVSRGDAAPCLASYLIEGLQTAANGTIKGKITPTNMDYPVFFSKDVIVDPAMIVDWRYVPKGAELAFGMYRMRTPLTDASKAELAALGLQPTAMPPGWDQ
jgi:hypothetical protein